MLDCNSTEDPHQPSHENGQHGQHSTRIISLALSPKPWLGGGGRGVGTSQKSRQNTFDLLTHPPQLRGGWGDGFPLCIGCDCTVFRHSLFAVVPVGQRVPRYNSRGAGWWLAGLAQANRGTINPKGFAINAKGFAIKAKSWYFKVVLPSVHKKEKML